MERIIPLPKVLRQIIVICVPGQGGVCLQHRLGTLCCLPKAWSTKAEGHVKLLIWKEG